MPQHKNEGLINKLHQGDCVEIMDRVSDETVDLVYADPPYKISPNRRGKAGQSDTPDKNWNTTKAMDQFYLDWMEACFRVLKVKGSLWVSCDLFALETALRQAKKAGFMLVQGIVWYKPNPQGYGTKRTLIRSHEHLLWFAKSRSYRFYPSNAVAWSSDHEHLKVGNKAMRDVWAIPSVGSSESLDFRFQKPVHLIRRILELCTVEGDLVVDPFSGMGTVPVVAHAMKRKWIAIEKDIDNYELASLRLSKLTP